MQHALKQFETVEFEAIQPSPVSLVVHSKVERQAEIVDGSDYEAFLMQYGPQPVREFA